MPSFTEKLFFITTMLGVIATPIAIVVIIVHVIRKK